MGAGLGAALVGTRPIIEMRIFDFVMCAMDELVNQIAKIRYMFGGQAKPAVVVRMPHGMWRNSAAQHSQMLEAWFAHLPGVVVVAPSSAGGRSGAAGVGHPLRRSGAVLRSEGSVAADGSDPRGEIQPIPFGQARRVREGGDADDRDVVGDHAEVAIAAAAARAMSGVKVDVYDLRTIWPWDEDAVVASVKKTKRLLVVHEAVEVGGFGAEIVARVIDRLGPPNVKVAKRLGAPRIPIPFSPPLEAQVRVTPDKIVAAARAVAVV